MGEGSEFTLLLEMPLEIDEAGLEQRDEAIIGDKDIALLMRENRIALAKGETTLVHDGSDAEADRVYYDVPLICVVHSHPECRFRWSRLIIDLSPTSDARIRDMAPREVRGDKPVELKTSVGISLRFETVARVLSAEIAPAHEKSRTVYYPDIVSSGAGFSRGYWDFLALTSDYLHANRELRLLVSAPAEKLLLARFILRAKVRLQGIAGEIPLLGGSSGKIDEIYRLA